MWCFPTYAANELPPTSSPFAHPFGSTKRFTPGGCICWSKKIYIYTHTRMSLYLHAQLSRVLMWSFKVGFCCCSFPGLTNFPLSSKGDVFCRSLFEKGGLLVVTNALKQRHARVSLGRRGNRIYGELLLQFSLLMEITTQVLSTFIMVVGSAS